MAHTHKKRNDVASYSRFFFLMCLYLPFYMINKKKKKKRRQK